MTPVFNHEVRVNPDMVDRNGHVNNVAYVQWMQDAAVQHARASGCLEACKSVGATWVVRSHQIEYLRPAYAGETIIILTWVSDWRKVRSLRKYKMIRAADQAVIAQAQTDWVLVDTVTGRPTPIPDEVKNTLPPVAQDQEP